MKKIKLMGFLVLALSLFWITDVHADTGIGCKMLDEEGKKNQILSVAVHNSSYDEFKPGDKFYVDVATGLTIKSTDRIAVLLRPTKNPDNHILTAYLKNINTRNEDSGAYFIIPSDAVVGEEYVIWGYNFYRDTDEIQGYSYSYDGVETPIYFDACAFYVTHEEDADKDDWHRTYIYNSAYTLKIVGDYREVKDVLKTLEIEESEAYFGQTYHFNFSTSEPIRRIVLGFNNDTFIDGHNSGWFESYMSYFSEATKFKAEVDVPTYGANYVYPGTYFLKTIMIYYPDGSYTRYSTDKATADADRETLYFETSEKIKLDRPESNIVGEGIFEVKNLTLESNSAKIGEKLPIRMEFSYDAASEELKTVLLTFRSEEQNTMFSTYVKSIIHDSYIIVPSVAREGNYTLESAVVTFEKNNGESSQIILNKEMYSQIFSQIVNISAKEAKKEETISTLYFSVNELNNDTYKMIKEAKEGSIVTIAADIDGIIPAEVFDSIKESTKQLVIDLYGNEWVFNGVDIEEIKPLDVSMNFDQLKNVELAENIKDAFGEDALAILFPNNGKLPGKALIRINDPSIFDQLKSDVFYVYHVNEDDNTVNRVATEIQKSYNGYVEFYINHNSTYVISTKEITNAELLGKDDDVMNVNSPEAKALEDVKKSAKGDDIMLYVIIGVCVALVAGVVFFLLKNKKKVNKVEEPKEEEKPVEENKPEDKEPEENEK